MSLVQSHIDTSRHASEPITRLPLCCVCKLCMANGYARECRAGILRTLFAALLSQTKLNGMWFSYIFRYRRQHNNFAHNKHIHQNYSNVYIFITILLVPLNRAPHIHQHIAQKVRNLTTIDIICNVHLNHYTSYILRNALGNLLVISFYARFDKYIVPAGGISLLLLIVTSKCATPATT